MLELLPQEVIHVHKNVRFHPDLSSSEKLFFAEIQAMIRSDEEGRLYYSTRKLAKHFDVSHQIVLTWIKHLIQYGLIEIKKDFKNRPRGQYIEIKKKSFR